MIDRDHPRGCGAHATESHIVSFWRGSSPRVRGSRSSVTLSVVLHGIIPAGAGLTSLSKTAAALDWDHPRGCGAHSSAFFFLFVHQGSSPRVRGSPHCKSTQMAGLGIIPAGAGLTGQYPAASRTSRDHPRGCGAHCLSTSSLHLRQGSSPRVRGSPRSDTVTHGDGGIIPAGAGLTDYTPR